LNSLSPFPPSLVRSTARAALFLFICFFVVVCLPASAKQKHKPARPHTKKSVASPTASSKDQPSHFERWTEVNQFIEKMAAQYGFDKTQLHNDFAQVRYQEAAIQLIKPAPPGKPKNWKAYRARFVENGRIEAGLAFWDQYSETLRQAENQYGVPAEIIVGLIGVETFFGRNTGNFRVIDALTTLAFAYPETPTRAARMLFFQSELESFLLFARESSSDPFSFKGSYAGAFGLAQFMPSSLRQYAVDFDHDGKINLLSSPADAIGSVAHYLAEHGWKKGLPTVFPATLTRPTNLSADEDQNFNNALNRAIQQGLRASFSLEQLKPIANTPASDIPSQLLYGLIDLQNGDEATEYWLATDNFFAITQYNRSYFYAMSVIDLGRVITSSRTK
jgi:membrane-bound lytic murein transglycosylase B